MRRSKRVCGVVLMAILGLPAPALAARSKSPRCRFTSAGGTLTSTVVLANTPLGRDVTLAVTRSGSPGGLVTTTTKVSRGRHSFLVLTATVTPTGALDTTAQLGAGFHGVQTIMLSSPDGNTFQGTIDGRTLAPFNADANPDTVRFADGSAIPKVKIKRALQAVLHKVGQVTFQSCSGVGQPSGMAVRPADVFGDLCKSGLAKTLGISACDCCQDACSVTAVGAEVGGILGCVATVVGCIVSEGLALKAQVDCYDACQHGSACCPVPCMGGTADQDCAATCSDNTVCCSGADNPNGQCCDNAADCCGGASSTIPTCLEGIFAGYQCANSQTGALCYPGQGDVCADTSTSGLYNGGGPLGSGSACCPAETPVCRDLGTNVCCAQGAGDVCGRECCPASTPHCDGVGSCCLVTDTCGPTGQCCPGPHVCLGSQCCNPPSHLCTSSLTGGTTCCQGSDNCNTFTGSCCPGLTTVVCGAKGCCDAATAACVGAGLSAQCCPKAQACGSVCCPAGQVCEDAGKGTCGACAPGTTPVSCQNDGTPSTDTCCATGVSCCADQCCPFASDQYGPVVCCTPVNSDVPPFANGQFGCHHQFACSA